jgi:hypothetical protein
MSKRDANADETRVAAPEDAGSAEVSALSQRDRVLASREQAGDAAGPESTSAGAPEPIETPAPPLDAAAATPDRSSSGASLIERRPEVLVAGAFAAGLALAIALRFMARG